MSNAAEPWGLTTLASSPTIPTSPVAGWYADPLSADQCRWWDGLMWTERVTVAPTISSASPSSDDVDVRETEGTPGVAPGWYVDVDGATRWWDGAGWSWPSAETTADPVDQVGEIESQAALAVPVVAELAAAGWYVTDGGETRWWDGSRWTDHTRVDAVEPEPTAESLASELAVPSLLAAGAVGAHALSDASSPAVEMPAHGVVAAELADAEDAAEPGPGWYTDEDIPGLVRWWDGVDWTPHAFVLDAAAMAAAAALLVLRSSHETPIVGDVPPMHQSPRAVSRARQEPRGWAIAGAWFLLFISISVALWYMAWTTTRSNDVPTAPALNVVNTPPPAPTPVPASPDDASPLPTLSIEQLPAG